MKRNICLFLLIIAFSLVSFGQNKLQDIVYLKNGSIIRGNILNQTIDESVKIETADFNVFVFQMTEVDSITKEVAKSKVKYLIDNPGLKRGYIGIIELGNLTGIMDNDYSRLMFNYINAYQMNPVFSIGFGTGVRYYSDGYIYTPIFADFRLSILNRGVAPFVSVNLGYSYNIADNFDPVGLLFSPSVGLRIRVSEKLSIYGSLNYEMQKSDRYYSYFDETEIIKSSSFGLSFGLIFN